MEATTPKRRSRLNGKRHAYEPSIELLYKAVQIDDATGCHVWTRAKMPKGYGRIHIKGKDHLTHRLSYELHVGPVPDEMFVCHKCDNPSCINPEHLFIGTIQDNHADMVQKGRNPRGEKQWNARLNEDYVRVIRLLKWTNKETAKLFGVTPDNIKHIRAGKRWAHVL
jgi:hypothetical protein